MTEQEAKHLEFLFDHGFMIKIDIPMYEDQFVGALFESEEGEYAGKMVYSSSVMDEAPMSSVDVANVKVFAPAFDVWKYNVNAFAYDNQEVIDGYNTRIEFSDEDFMKYGIQPELLDNFITAKSQRRNIMRSILEMYIDDIDDQVLDDFMQKEANLDLKDMQIRDMYEDWETNRELLAGEITDLYNRIVDTAKLKPKFIELEF